MNKTLLLAALFAGGAAQAADAALGATLYHDRCVACHHASPNPVDRPGKAPDLVRLMKTKDAVELNAWILEPGKRTKDTACDTSGLAKNPELLPHLWAFLQGRLDAPPLPRVERHQVELSNVDLDKWRNRKRGAR